jgi:hypothetical protein
MEWRQQRDEQGQHVFGAVGALAHGRDSIRKAMLPQLMRPLAERQRPDRASEPGGDLRMA